MSIASSRGFRKGIRTLLQTIAGGGLTALVTVLANGLSPRMSLFVMAIFTALVAYLQNGLEGGGIIPVLLPSPGLVSASVETVAPIVAPLAAATVDAVVDSTGQVVGDVTDLTGDIVGKVTGQLSPEDDSEGHS